jgi:hypothetical protein
MSEPTGNEAADEFLAQLDARIAGAHGTPPESQARLRAMRPLLRAKVISDPASFEAFAEGWFEAEESGLGRDA